ncbi:hypothetical protein Q604_UNBC17993G0001, partial [human gut metagenome]
KIFCIHNDIVPIKYQPLKPGRPPFFPTSLQENAYNIKREKGHSLQIEKSPYKSREIVTDKLIYV